jgi:predicted transcriptional regulator
MKVLLSIKPEYAEKIFSGEKRYEFRKAVFKNQLIQTVVVYATMPVGRIIGEFNIKQILKDEPEHIWEMTKEYSGINMSFFIDYFNGRNFAFAIEVDKPKLYKKAINPKEEFERFTAPQSFMYL